MLSGEEGKPAVDPAKPAEPAKPAPVLVDEKWEPKAAEGVTRDTKLFGEARALFAKMGLNAEQAQALVDFSDTQSKAGAEAQVKAADEARTKFRAEGRKELEADKELGGAKLAETKVTYARAVRALGGDQLARELREMGLDNWPPLVRAFEKAGRTMAEDTVSGTVKGNGKTPGDPFQRQLEQTYPSMFQNKEQ